MLNFKIWIILCFSNSCDLKGASAFRFNDPLAWYYVEAFIYVSLVINGVFTTVYFIEFNLVTIKLPI
jgi:hypothetical protein